MAAFETLVDLIPNTDDLEGELDEGFEADVDLGGEIPDQGQEGDGDTSGSGGQGGATMFGEFGAIFSEIAGSTALVAGLLGTVVGLLASLEPIQAILDILFTSLQLFLFPIAQLLFTLLRPVLTGLLDLIPLWLGFFQSDPVEDTTTSVAEELGVPEEQARGLGSATSDLVQGTLSFLNPGFSTLLGESWFGGSAFGRAFDTIQGLFNESEQGRPRQNQTTVNVNGLDPDAQVEKISSASDRQTRRTFGR